MCRAAANQGRLYIRSRPTLQALVLVARCLSSGARDLLSAGQCETADGRRSVRKGCEHRAHLLPGQAMEMGSRRWDPGGRLLAGESPEWRQWHCSVRDALALAVDFNEETLPMPDLQLRLLLDGHPFGSGNPHSGGRRRFDLPSALETNGSVAKGAALLRLRPGFNLLAYRSRKRFGISDVFFSSVRLAVIETFDLFTAADRPQQPSAPDLRSIR